MDFDEYDYLEKTVEEDKPSNGAPSNDRNQGKSSKGLSDEDAGEGEHAPKRVKSEDEGAARDLDRRRDSSRHRSSPERRSREEERSEKERHRSGREHRDGDRSRKDGRRDKERDKERDRERSKERSRDRERDKDRHRDRERNKERDRDRDGDRDRDKDRHRDRERDREKDRDRDRDRIRERDREREQDRSRHSRKLSEKHRDEDRDTRREKSKDRDIDERVKESREKEGHTRRHKDKKEEGAEPEVDPERDQRTVFAYQISLKADERDVYDFFSKAGRVRDVRLITDRMSRRSRGVGYVEFYDAMSVPMAIALSGQLLLGQPVMVKPSEAEKNLAQSNTVSGAGGPLGPNSGGGRRLYVGNIHPSITEEQIRQVFEPFGPVELVQLPREPGTNNCKGYGFIQFVSLEDARAAQSLNGQLEIAGRVIKVSTVSEQVGMHESEMNTADLDDDEGAGLALNAQSRALLMQKLDRSGSTGFSLSLANSSPGASVLGAPPPAALLGPPPLPGLVGLPVLTLPLPVPPVPQIDLIGVPSECLLLKNMFDPSTETEPDFDLDIKEDVQDECSRFGQVKHIFVDKSSAGFVYLRFDSASSAISAQRALHGRWFAGKMITATFMLPQTYSAKFPGA